MPALLRAAALRFWISRLWDLHLPRDAAMLKPHDPDPFRAGAALALDALAFHAAARTAPS